MEAVEERATVHRHRVGKSSLANRQLEITHIGSDERRVQPQIGATEKNSLAAERLSNVIERLRQRVAGLVRVAFGPQQPKKLVARDSAVADAARMVRIARSRR